MVETEPKKIEVGPEMEKAFEAGVESYVPTAGGHDLQEECGFGKGSELPHIVSALHVDFQGMLFMRKKDGAEVTQHGSVDMQVCAPSGWTDDQVKAYADAQNPCGTSQGWRIRREGDRALDGAPERMPCKSRDGFVHIMLDA